MPILGQGGLINISTWGILRNEDGSPVYGFARSVGWRT